MTEEDWTRLVCDLRNISDVDVAVSAAQELHRAATAEELSCVRSLLRDASAFVREAAAWPLSELAGAAAQPELFEAFQRGMNEGHDNDGFSAALIDLAGADPEGARRALAALSTAPDPALQSNVTWLMEFCENHRDA